MMTFPVITIPQIEEIGPEENFCIGTSIKEGSVKRGGDDSISLLKPSPEREVNHGGQAPGAV